MTSDTITPENPTPAAATSTATTDAAGPASAVTTPDATTGTQLPAAATTAIPVDAQQPAPATSTIPVAATPVLPQTAWVSGYGQPAASAQQTGAAQPGVNGSWSGYPQQTADPRQPTFVAPPQQPAAPLQPTSGPAYLPVQPRTNVLGILTLVFGILGFGVVPVVTGHIALGQIKRTGEEGRGLTLAGLILGYVTVAGWLLVALFWIGAFGVAILAGR